MTLILAMANRRQVVLVADRRLTVNGCVIEDESNKASVFLCRNARLAIAYTGLAQVRSFKTSEWLPDALMESAKSDFLMAPTIQRFRERATKDFAKLQVSPSDKRFTAVLAGYSYEDSSPRFSVSLVSNFESLEAGDTVTSGKPFHEFAASSIRDARSQVEEMHCFLSAGAGQSMSDPDIESLGTLLRENRPPQALVSKGVAVIRAAADSVRSRQTIGKQCTSIVLPSTPEERVTAHYHSDKPAPREYFPSLIKAVGDGSAVYAITDPWTESRDAHNQPIPSVPKVGRNDRCPCGSGRKFKQCHGR